MGVISYEVPINAQRMTIGVQGENNVREFLFDVTEWRQLTGDIGTAEMVIQRRGDSSPYAAVITMHDENTVSWIPVSADTAKAGAGKIQLMWIANGQTVKTKIFDMKVDPALDYQLPDDSLDPWASWMPDVINAAAAMRDLPGMVADAAADWLEENIEPTTPAVDASLSVSGAAADAKVTGGKVTELKSAINGSVIAETNNAEDWTAGEYWAVEDGEIVTGLSWGRSKNFLDPTITSITAKAGFKLFLLAYNGLDYVGAWFGSDFVKTYDASYICTNINLAYFRSRYPNYKYVLTITRIGPGRVSISDLVQNITIAKSTPLYIVNAISAFFGGFANKNFWYNGTINSLGIVSADSSNWKNRIATLPFLRFLLPVTITPNNNYRFSVTTYSLDGDFINQFSAWQTTPYTFTDSDKLYRIVINSLDGTTPISPNNINDFIDVKLLYATPFSRMLSEFSNVKIVNHRGYNTVAPENTIPAYKLSAELGFKYVETDILFTSDGIPVLMHDDTINRTCCNASNGAAITSSISIESISYNDLITNYDACSPAQWSVWKGIKVPTLNEFLACCKAYNLHPWIELKWTHTYTEAEIKSIISAVRNYGLEEHVSFISFSYDALSMVVSEWDSVEVGLNGTVADANNLKTGKNRVFMIYNYTSNPTPAIEAGYQICLYTINTSDTLSAINTPAYDSILTNSITPFEANDAIRSKWSG